MSYIFQIEIKLGHILVTGLGSYIATRLKVVRSADSYSIQG